MALLAWSGKSDGKLCVCEVPSISSWYHMEHMQARHRLKQHHRARLGHIGLGFCDDNAARLQKLEQLYADARGIWEAESTLCHSVLAAAWHASTTDNELQTIGTTLSNDRLFWSSTGSQTQIADEALLYELESPACQVHFVRMAVYRAFYQHGYPVYPPMQLQVWAGPSPAQLQPASQAYDVQATDALQTFALAPNAPVARFLQLRMHGKLQKQREDMQFYIAIRHVSAVGCVVPSSQLLNLKAVLHSGVARLKPGGQLPGSCCAGLRNVTGWGLGPWEAASGAVAAGRILALSDDREQRQQQGTWISGGDSSSAEQLLVRRQQQQSGSRSGKRPHQHLTQQLRKQQQQQRAHSGQAGSSDHAASGFWSSLGSGLSKWRSPRRHSDTSAAAAAAESSSAAPGTMQVQSDVTEARPISASAAVGGAATVPKWLLPDAAEHSQQQQQQYASSQGSKQAVVVAASAGRCSSSSSASEAGYEGDYDTDEQMTAQHHVDGAHAPGGDVAAGLAAVHDLAGAAEQARMELLLWQALNRLPNPEDPVDREQLLAAWLEDEPLHSNIPAAFKQQMLQQQLAASNTLTQGGQQLPGGWQLRPQPVVRCSSSRGPSNAAVPGRPSTATQQQQQQQQQQDCKEGNSTVILDQDLAVTCSVHILGELVLPPAAVAHSMQLAPAAAETAAVALARGLLRLDEPELAAAETLAEVGSEITADDVEQQQQQPGVIRVSASDLFSVASLCAINSSSSRCQSSCSWMDEGVEQDWFLQQQIVLA